MAQKLEGFHRKLYLTRYAQKSTEKLKYIIPGATVITLVKDGEFPIREIATVKKVIGDQVHMELQTADGMEFHVGNSFVQDINLVDALLETEYSQT
ncbi:MAG: hypothetical protein RR603_06365, partial [Kurthia sp.]